MSVHSDSTLDASAERSHTFSADLAMLSVAVIWGVNMPIMKFALSRVDEYLFNATRLLVSAIVLALIAWQQKAPIINRGENAPPIWRQIGMIVVFAFMTGFAYQVLFLLGIDRTSAGNTALIMSALPVWTALLAMILIKETLTKNAWIGLAIALVGTIVVTFTVPKMGAKEGSLWGNFLVAAATFSWALGSVWSRPMMKQISPIGLAFCGVAIAVPFHFIACRHAFAELSLFLNDMWLLAALFFSGGFSTGVAYAFWNYGVKTLGTSHAAVFQNLVPFFALFASWLLIGEVPSWIQLIGGGIILTGLFIMRKNRKS